MPIRAANSACSGPSTRAWSRSSATTWATWTLAEYVTDETTRHNQAVYDQIAPHYARRQAGRKPSFSDLMDALTARLPAQALVADLGCGPGHDGARIIQAGHRVVDIDRSAAMLAIAAGPLAGQVT